MPIDLSREPAQEMKTIVFGSVLSEGLRIWPDVGPEALRNL